ncbi:MAG TPA: type II secretion system F family protein [Bacillota bacterium]|nr:type II secretion system F family protein [Bacillota bacterium]
MSYQLSLCFWLVFGAVMIFMLGMSRRKKEKHWANVRAITTSWNQFNEEKEQKPGGIFGGLVAEAEMAGLNVSAGQLIVVLFAGMIGGFVFGYAVTGVMLFSVAGAFLGLFLPGVWVRRKIEGRARAFEEQLEKGLTAMAASLHAGSNTVQAVEEAARQAQPPLKEVMEETLSLLSTGATLPEALEAAGRKVKSRDMAMVASAISVNMRTGAKLVNVLDQVVDSVRVRRLYRAQFAAKGAQARAAGNILVAVPLVFLFIFRMMNPEYMKPLLKTATGNAMLGFALSMFFVGWIIIRRLLAVEVE